MCNLIFSFQYTFVHSDSVLDEKISSRITIKYDFVHSQSFGLSLPPSLRTILFGFVGIALCFGYCVQSSILLYLLNVHVYQVLGSRWFSIYYFIVVRMRRQL